MSTKSEEVGKNVVQGIDTLEKNTHKAVHAGASSARQLTKTGSRWAGRQERQASVKAQTLRRDVYKQAKQLRKTAHSSLATAASQTEQVVARGGEIIKRKPWQTIAIASGAALLVGALLGKRRS